MADVKPSVCLVKAIGEKTRRRSGACPLPLHFGCESKALRRLYQGLPKPIACLVVGSV